jgi:hypothetical protein
MSWSNVSQFQEEKWFQAQTKTHKMPYGFSRSGISSHPMVWLAPYEKYVDGLIKL